MFSALSGGAADWPLSAFWLWASINCARRSAQASPAGPAPTIRTSVSSVSRSVLCIRETRDSKLVNRKSKIEARPSFEFRISNFDFPVLLLWQSGHLLLDVGQQRGVGAELLFEVLVKLAGLGGVGGAVGVRQGEEGRRLGHHQSRMVGEVLVKLLGIREFAAAGILTAERKPGERSNILVGGPSRLFKGLDRRRVVPERRLAHAHVVAGDGRHFLMREPARDFRELLERLLVFCLRGREGRRISAQHFRRRIPDVGPESLERRAELGVGRGFLAVVVEFQAGGEPQNHNQRAHHGYDFPVVGLGKLLERLEGGPELVLLEFTARETVQGFAPSLAFAGLAWTPYLDMLATGATGRQLSADQGR